MSVPLPVQVGPKDWQEGPADAPVTIVEYGDFQCGDCREAWFVLKALREQNESKIRFVYRHLPLTDIHERALLAAKASEAAGAQGKFWPMHDALYGAQTSLTEEDILHDAAQVGMDETTFTVLLADEQTYAAVRADVDGIRVTGLNRTPILFLNGSQHTGPISLSALTEAVANAEK